MSQRELESSDTGSVSRHPVVFTAESPGSTTTGINSLNGLSVPQLFPTDAAPQTDSWRSILSMSPVSDKCRESNELYLSPSGVSVGLKSDESDDDAEPMWYRNQVQSRRRSCAQLEEPMFQRGVYFEQNEQPTVTHDSANVYVHPLRPWSISCMEANHAANVDAPVHRSSFGGTQARDTAGEDRASWPSSSNDPTQTHIDTLNTTTSSDNQPNQPLSVQSHLVMQDGQSLTELMPPHVQPDADALGVKFSMLRSQREYVLRFYLPGFELDGIALTTKGFNKRTMHLIANRWDADGNVQFDRRITFSADAALSAIRARFEHQTLHVTIPRKLL